MTTDLLDAVREDVADVHRFIVDWFNGSAAQEDLDTALASRLDEGIFYVTPDGHRLDRDDILALFAQAHGSNPDFRIKTRDVHIRHQMGDNLVVTYTELQRGARASANVENARITTVILTRDRPFRWLHIHETWLPEEVRAAARYDF